MEGYITYRDSDKAWEEEILFINVYKVERQDREIFQATFPPLNIVTGERKRGCTMAEILVRQCLAAKQKSANAKQKSAKQKTEMAKPKAKHLIYKQLISS